MTKPRGFEGFSLACNAVNRFPRRIGSKLPYKINFNRFVAHLNRVCVCLCVRAVHCVQKNSSLFWKFSSSHTHTHQIIQSAASGWMRIYFWHWNHAYLHVQCTQHTHLLLYTQTNHTHLGKIGVKENKREATADTCSTQFLVSIFGDLQSNAGTSVESTKYAPANYSPSMVYETIFSSFNKKELDTIICFFFHVSFGLKMPDLSPHTPSVNKGAVFWFAMQMDFFSSRYDMLCLLKVHFIM